MNIPITKSQTSRGKRYLMPNYASNAHEDDDLFIRKIKLSDSAFLKPLSLIHGNCLNNSS